MNKHTLHHFFRTAKLVKYFLATDEDLIVQIRCTYWTVEHFDWCGTHASFETFLSLPPCKICNTYPMVSGFAHGQNKNLMGNFCKPTTWKKSRGEKVKTCRNFELSNFSSRFIGKVQKMAAFDATISKTGELVCKNCFTVGAQKYIFFQIFILCGPTPSRHLH